MCIRDRYQRRVHGGSEDKIRSKIGRYESFPLPPDAGRWVQVIDSKPPKEEEIEAHIFYLQRWRAWVRQLEIDTPPVRKLTDEAPPDDLGGVPLVDPMDVGSAPERAALVDHLVMCEELEDCREGPRKAAWMHIGKYLNALYNTVRLSSTLPRTQDLLNTSNLTDTEPLEATVAEDNNEV
eukprot:NODE_9749_length_567_cov_42.182432_g9111_i0.p1 GENE.NODE_9749_length_567_cov_42.182432_g9111_i0~~NODE_9749_length_567_cov_42.182432_g9111_i0.p1  ORF type:complete len:180 (-),score=48.74 NODE_9749_length_567_cov_42.182432_g9111_i0:28-567(-)